eukprot:scaffold10215_cov47-Phaeocystis_antarctica.AAC.1
MRSDEQNQLGTWTSIADQLPLCGVAAWVRVRAAFGCAFLSWTRRDGHDARPDLRSLQLASILSISTRDRRDAVQRSTHVQGSRPVVSKPVSIRTTTLKSSGRSVTSTAHPQFPEPAPPSEAVNMGELR